MPAPTSVTGVWAKVFLGMSMLNKTTIPRIKNVAFVLIVVSVDDLHGFKDFDKGKGVAAYGKNTNKTQGAFFIGLLNDNTFQGIDANVKISVIWETKYYEDKSYIERNIAPRYEKKTFSEPEITTSTVPVTGE